MHHITRQKIGFLLFSTVLKCIHRIGLIDKYPHVQMTSLTNNQIKCLATKMHNDFIIETLHKQNQRDSYLKAAGIRFYPGRSHFTT